jgi:uncharacterized membrane protein
VPREDVLPLDMSVDDAMRLVFTLGVVAPPWSSTPGSRSTQDAPPGSTG